MVVVVEESKRGDASSLVFKLPILINNLYNEYKHAQIVYVSYFVIIDITIRFYFSSLSLALALAPRTGLQSTVSMSHIVQSYITCIDTHRRDLWT